ncbi:putative 3-alpha-(S)-strictosidine beta-glucosidase [Helianthus annuus]|nr:putative 3-alpha-(S)-strictosidine beta-glucosidase [Helianthus annuus]
MGKNLEGINYYNRLIDELKANDIEPFVTLFHWDLPNALEEEYMGFLSSKIVDDFVNYAEICFWEFGDRVKNWVTLNEPYRFAYGGYVQGIFAPGRGGSNQDGDPETEPYIVAYNLLNCHAAAYRKYQEDFKDVQKGQVGITLDTNFFKPFRGKDNTDDVQAVEYAYDFMLGWFLEPITSGNWPVNVQNFATAPSVHHPQGRYLPVLTDDQKIRLIQSYDFLGINYYTANYAQIYSTSSLSSGFLDDRHYKASGD